MRELWKGELHDLPRRWYKVDGARIYTLPRSRSIYVAAGAADAAQLAGRPATA